MHLSTMFFKPAAAAYLLLCLGLASHTAAYFVVNEPHRGTEWSNGRANLASWGKGVLDGIAGFDVEMARLSKDGLTFVARNVPANAKSLNIELQDLPPGDDYFLVFLNATHGIMYATSERFTVLASGTSPSSDQPSPDSSAPTITVSGAPNPTQAFATTFPAVEGGARPILGAGGDVRLWSLGVLVVCLLSATWTVW